MQSSCDKERAKEEVAPNAFAGTASVPGSCLAVVCDIEDGEDCIGDDDTSSLGSFVEGGTYLSLIHI